MTSKTKEQYYPGSILPSRTLNWLNLNDTNSYYDPKRDQAPYKDWVLGPEGKERNISQDLDPDLEELLMKGSHGISPQILEENRDKCNLQDYALMDEAHFNRFDLPLKEGQAQLIDRHQIRVKEGRRAVAMFDLHAEDGVAGYRNGTITIDLPEDALLHLVILDRLNDATTNNLSIVANLADGAVLYVSHVEKGGGKSNFNFGCDMPGFESLLDISTAFLGEGKGDLDLYYDVNQIAPYTDVKIVANGALLDESRKNFRGTIDFKEGSYGAVGDEASYTILMNDKVKDLAIPILLCHEDDVVGNHAASAGQLDEDMLFYVQTRGIPRKEAEGMIVEARMVPTLDRIPDPDLRESLQKQIHERIVQR